MIISYRIRLPESPCAQHFLESNPAPPALWALYSLGHSGSFMVLRSLLPPPAKNCPGPCPWAGQKVQHGMVVLWMHTHRYVGIDLLVLHRDICSSLSLFISSPYVLIKCNALCQGENVWDALLTKGIFSPGSGLPDSQTFSEGSIESELFVP